jgi:hypothetical protein
VIPLKIEIPVKNFGRQRCAEEFNSNVEGLTEKQTTRSLNAGIKSLRAALPNEFSLQGILLLVPCVSLIYA